MLPLPRPVEGEPSARVTGQASARSAEVGAIVREASLSPEALDVLHDIAQEMLRSSRAQLLSIALRRIFDAVPAAQRVTVVKWPPDPKQGLQALLPADVLRREGIQPGPVSTTIARHAVEAGQALYFFHGADIRGTIKEAPSVRLNSIQSAIYVPLMGPGDRLHGLLCVDTPQPTAPLTRLDFQFVRAVGALLASALHAESLREEAYHQQMLVREEVIRREAMAESLRIAAHDLRSPLAMIHLGAQALRECDDPETRRVTLTDIQAATQRAVSLVAAYIESAAAQPTLPVMLVARRTPVKPGALIDEEIRLLQATSDEANGHVFKCHVACQDVSADRDKLQQIFGNLISNAAKYSPDGTEILVESEEDASGVTFHIIDHGIGISSAEQAHLFQPYQRLGDVDATEGTGLGLWLTRGLVEAHGGRIWVDSTLGVGSTFSFWLPRL